MPEIAAILLAAGKSSRYLAAGGLGPTKLVAEFRGEPIVRAVARSALASRAKPVIVVTGHARVEVEAALTGLPVSFAHNADFATGLASSLRAGVAALARDVAGVVVLLGDMPGVEPNTVNALIDAFGARQGALAAIPIFGGRRGNPVLLGRGLFPAVARMTGDEGARGLLREAGEAVVEVSLDDAAVTFDIDTPGDLEPAAG